MIGIGALGVLAVVDGAFAGYRAAAGRDGRIDKRVWYREAMARGAAAGAVASLALVALMLALRVEVAEAETAAGRALLIYLPFAGVLGVAALARRVEHVDVRSIASLLVFGPFTLLRPFVLLAGVVAAVVRGSSEIMILGIGALVLMAVVESSLHRVYARRAT